VFCVEVWLSVVDCSEAADWVAEVVLAVVLAALGACVGRLSEFEAALRALWW
jgi:hypothetical protein